MRLKFRKPPLDELVIGKYFSPLEKLHVEHIGLFWARVADELPRCEQQPPIAEFSQTEGDVFPFPRFWFISADDTSLVQVQRNAFIANWRRRADQDAYPHYENVKQFFDDKLAKFAGFTKERLGVELTVAALELAYINFLTIGEIKQFSDLATMMPGLSQFGISEKLGNVTGFSATYQVQVSSNLTLRVKLDRARKQRKDIEMDGLRLELRAKGLPESLDTEHAALWFDEAHDHISKMFIAITSEEIRKSWEPVEGPEQ